MSEWWTYRLSDFLLFSPDTYRRLFELYNAAVWPAHVAALLLGLLALVLASRLDLPDNRRKGSKGRAGAILAILSLCWGWVAWVFHLGHYQTINWAAAGFAGAFGLQALLLAACAGIASRTQPGSRPRPEGEPSLGRGTVCRRRRRIGLSLTLLALFALPGLDLLLGRPWMQSALFGLAPDPTALATLGLLLMLPGGGRAVLWPLPLAWCAISGATLWAMNAPEAPLLPAAAACALAARLLCVGRPMRRSRLTQDHGKKQ
jgi:hypothetical protein